MRCPHIRPRCQQRWLCHLLSLGGRGLQQKQSDASRFLEAPTAVRVLSPRGSLPTQPRVAWLGMWVLSPKRAEGQD